MWAGVNAVRNVELALFGNDPFAAVLLILHSASSAHNLTEHLRYLILTLQKMFQWVKVGR